jgi:hypothetical protein
VFTNATNHILKNNLMSWLQKILTIWQNNSFKIFCEITGFYKCILIRFNLNVYLSNRLSEADKIVSVENSNAFCIYNIIGACENEIVNDMGNVNLKSKIKTKIRIWNVEM